MSQWQWEIVAFSVYTVLAVGGMTVVVSAPYTWSGKWRWRWPWQS
jgi:hypothetical protein